MTASGNTPQGNTVPGNTPHDPGHRPQTGSARADEVARFDRLADSWWDPDGPMAALHAMNGLRVGWIARRARQRLGARPLRVLDIGCGAGLAAEALARAGHDVLGIDAAPGPIAAARAHADGEELPLRYEIAAPEDLPPGQPFDLVTALEVVEHVTDLRAFIRTAAALVAPGGLLAVSTINRTLRSLAVAKIGAEYIVRLLPVGTHDWRRFVTPGELTTAARAAGLHTVAVAGMSFNPLNRQWSESRDHGINYITAFARPPAPA